MSFRFYSELLHEFGMAGAASFPFEVLVDLPATLCIGLPDLVESAGVVVGSDDAGQRRQCRGLVRAVPRAARTTGCRQHVRRRTDVIALRRLCVRLCLQI